MSTLKVCGGNPLRGEIAVYGAKNAVLPILAASIMTTQQVVLRGCPMLSDVRHMVAILESLGARVKVEGDVITIDPRHADSHEMPEDLCKQMRSSIFLLGALISRFQKAWVTQPGGCEIGLRPIDLHLKGLRALNVQINEAFGEILCVGNDTRGAEVTLDYPSVGATENIMMAAVMAKGETVLRNAAREPEVADLAAFINTMGGRVRGAGTDCIVIERARAAWRDVYHHAGSHRGRYVHGGGRHCTRRRDDSQRGAGTPQCHGVQTDGGGLPYRL